MQEKLFQKFSGFKKWVVSHKKTSIVLALVIIFLGYKIYQNYTNTAGIPKYILTTVQKGMIITTITGTGQVSANNQVDVASKASGNITKIEVVPGQMVKAGELLATVDSTDAYLSLQSAQLTYDKFVEPAKPEDIKAAQVNVVSAYNDAWNSISSTFVDYPNILTGMDSLFYSTTGYLNDQSVLQKNDTYIPSTQKAGVSYDAAKNQYQTILIEYNSLSRASATSSIDLLIKDTEVMVKMMADALKNTQSSVSLISQGQSDTSTKATTAANNVNSWLNSVNTHLSAIISAQSSIANNQNTFNNLVQGPDTIDTAAQQITLQKAQSAYANYFVRAPFDGTVAKVQAAIGNPAGTVATIVSNSKIATISLNEVDVSKIKTGDKVNLSFDAIDGLNITGQVAEIDLVGTVSQGVVNYNVKISFDTQDDRVKSGMSVNASVITQSKQDVLTVPSSAIKLQNGISYVQYFDAKYTDIQASAGIITTIIPLSKKVEIGISDDTNTEIISGLNQGEQIVSRTVVNTTTTTSAPSILNAATGNRSGAAGATRRIGG
jgi:HlyD family secretion protein